MKRKPVFNALCFLLTLCLIMPLLPIGAAAAAPAGYVTDSYGAMAYKVLNGNSVDVYGDYNGSWLRTTYADGGYSALASEGLSVAVTPSIVNNGSFVKLLYKVTAKTDVSAADNKFLSVNADTQIGQNDHAPIELFFNSKGEPVGISMVDNNANFASCGAEFRMFFRGVQGVTDVDTFWYGYYSSRSSNLTSSTIMSALQARPMSIASSSGAYAWVDDKGNPAAPAEAANLRYTGDSGLAVSWTMPDMKEGQKIEFSILVGIGAADEAATPYVLTINYRDEAGKSVGTQAISAPAYTEVTGGDLNIPAGYTLKGSFYHMIIQDDTVDVTVTGESLELTINYVDEDGAQVGSQIIQTEKDASVGESDLLVPDGYKLKGSFGMTVTADETVDVPVVKTGCTLTVNYLDEDGVKVGTQEISVKKGGTVTEKDFSVPSGYEFKGSFSTTVNESETVSVTVIKKEKNFDASDWAQEELDKADELGLIPDSLRDEDLTKPITRAEFAAVSVKLYETLSGIKALPAIVNPFTDTKDVEVLKAYNVGITNGTSETEFSPDLLLIREQAAAMLTRAFKRVTMPGWTLEDDGSFPLNYTKPNAFADDANISDYARDSVYFLAAFDIIKGFDNNIFAPKNTTPEQEALGYANATREQAIVIALRMAENL